MISDQIAPYSVQFPLFICDFLEFPLVKYMYSKIFTQIRLLLLQKLVFHEKKALTKAPPKGSTKF